jgi:hypothetical protein
MMEYEVKLQQIREKNEIKLKEQRAKEEKRRLELLEKQKHVIS